ALTDLVPTAAQDLLSRVKVAITSSALAGLGFFGLGPAAGNAGPPSLPVSSASALTITDREKKGAKLVLALRDQSPTVTVQHRSHSSHRSHYSSRGGSGGGSVPAY